jgi:Escherichia/Staphylococcus phage prohead protease
VSSETIRRTFGVDLESVAGRDVYGRVVPYGSTAEVADETPAGVRVYREQFELGAFSRAGKAPNRVAFTHEHGETLPDQLGHATELLERADGLYGTFRVTAGPLGDHALQLVRDGDLRGLSVLARTLGESKRRGGVVIRTACHLIAVGLTRKPSYTGAEVLAVRSREVLEREYLRPNAELDARLAALGIGQPAE